MDGDFTYKGAVLSSKDVKIFRTHFERLDVDGNGTIDHKDVRSILTDMQTDNSMRTCRFLISELDSDKKGYVSLNDYLKLMVRLRHGEVSGWGALISHVSHTKSKSIFSKLSRNASEFFGTYDAALHPTITGKYFSSIHDRLDQLADPEEEENALDKAVKGLVKKASTFFSKSDLNIRAALDEEAAQEGPSEPPGKGKKKHKGAAKLEMQEAGKGAKKQSPLGLEPSSAAENGEHQRHQRRKPEGKKGQERSKRESLTPLTMSEPSSADAESPVELLPQQGRSVSSGVQELHLEVSPTDEAAGGEQRAVPRRKESRRKHRKGSAGSEADRRPSSAYSTTSQDLEWPSTQPLEEGLGEEEEGEWPEGEPRRLEETRNLSTSFSILLRDPKIRKFLLREKSWPLFTILTIIVHIGLVGLYIGLNSGIDSLFENPFVGITSRKLLSYGARYPPCMREVVPSSLEKLGLDSKYDMIPCPFQPATNGSCTYIDGLEYVCQMGGFKGQVPDQGWRLVTSLFLSPGVIHLVVILLFLFRVGVNMEKQIGTIRIFLIYMLSGVVGNMLSALMSPATISSGCSPALFGLFALLFIDIIQNWVVLKHPRRDLFLHIFLCLLLFGLGFLPFVDNYAHLGGFLTGFLAGFILVPSVNFGSYDGRRKKIILAFSIPSLVVLLFFSFFTFFYGIDVGNCDICQYFECIPPSSPWCALG